MDRTWQKLEEAFGNNLQKDFFLSKVTTLEIGGPAKYFYLAKTQTELQKILKFCKQEGIPHLVIGGGSNLLVSDVGFNGLVIKNEVSGISSFARPGLAGVSLDVQGGTVLQDLVDFTLKHGLTGIQKLTGIPGTLAGAVYGNAGAYGQTISDHIQEVVCFDGKKVFTLSKDECGFGYRDSGFKQNGLVILEVIFVFPQGSSEDLTTEAKDTLKLRQSKYPAGILCPGSFFKNLLEENLSEETLAKLPPRKDTFGKVPSWILLEQVGAKGARLGNIKIANFHANLFINSGGGKASDFWQLAAEYQKKVKERFGINLEPEVQLINLPPLT